MKKTFDTICRFVLTVCAIVGAIIVSAACCVLE